MEIIKYNTISHCDEKGRPQAIFTCSLSPDNRVLFTGSLDSTITAWTELAGPRPLAPTLTRHEGSVLAVRAHPADPTVFASTGDDRRILVWAFQPALALFQVSQRLAPQHTNDITGLEWSGDGRFLVSGGLDKSVVVWAREAAGGRGGEFKVAGRVDVGGFVKGIAVRGRLVGVQLDSKSASIYEIHVNEDGASVQLRLVQTITDCFSAASDSVFFSRPSFSPDGAVIALSNASNGPIPCGCLVKASAADQIDDYVSLIGHYGPIEVCSFSPVFYSATSTLLCMGGQDGSVSVWSGDRTAPLAVLTDLSDQAVTDICWSPDGASIYVSFYEGFVGCLRLSELLTGPISRHIFTEDAGDMEIAAAVPDILPPLKPDPAPASVPSNKDGRKRVTPMLLSVAPTVNSKQFPDPSKPGANASIGGIALTFSALPHNRFPHMHAKASFHFELAISDPSGNPSLRKRCNIEITANKIQCTDGHQVFWREFLEKPCSHAVSHDRWIAVLFGGNELALLDYTGKRLLPRMHFEAPVSLVKLYSAGLVVVLTSGQLLWFDRFYALQSLCLPDAIRTIDTIETEQNGCLLINSSYRAVDGCWFACNELAADLPDGIGRVKRLLELPRATTDRWLEEAAGLKKLLDNLK